MLSYVLLFAVEVYTVIVQRIFASKVLTSKKLNKYVDYCVWILFFITSNASTYLVIKGIWYNSIIVCLLLLITLKILYDDSFATIFITSIFLLVSGILSEFITVYFWIFLTNSRWEGDLSGNGTIEMMIISKIVLFLVIKFLIVIITGKRSDINFLDWTEIFLVPTGSIFIVDALFVNKDGMDRPINVFAISMLLFINIFTYHLYEKTKMVTEQRIREEMLKEESLYYIRQYNDNEKIWNDLRKFRHNIKEQYITQKIMLENKEYEKLDKMFDDVLDITSSKVNVSNTGNFYFDSIINFKATIADSFGIQIKLDAIIPTDASVDVEDINLCLGNLLDNAIEALKAFDSDKVIDLQLKSEEGNLWISISNSCLDKTIKKDGKYITTKNDSKWHGLGLSIVKGIVDKYDGDMKIDETDGKFKVKILMYEFLN